MGTIVFQPSGRTFSLQKGQTLLDACLGAGFRLRSPCGGKGLCGKCRVRVLEGYIPADARQAACLSGDLLASGWRAACLVTDCGNLVLADPDAADAGSFVLADFRSRRYAGTSGWWRRDVVLPSPDRVGNDFALLADELHSADPGLPDDLEMDASLLANLPAVLRACAYHCRVVGFGNHIRQIRLAGGGKKAGLFGLAVDIGTTTLAAVLCDLETGETLAVASAANPQDIHGDDVITRVEYAAKGKKALAEMQSLVVSAVEKLCADVRDQARAAHGPVQITVAANPAMNHIFLGIPPDSLAVSPFTPAFQGSVWTEAETIGWRGEAPHPLVHVVPNMGGFVGGDVVAGLLAHDVHKLEGVTLFLDVGTNGEIALTQSGRIMVCATAAGPAFEGARIDQGMRAAPGAISRVESADDGSLEIGVIDGAAPVGLCGTGLLDATAVLLRAGLIDSTGLVLDPDSARKARPHIQAGLVSLLHQEDDGSWSFWLKRPSGLGGMGVKLTQRDIRELQLAKGAMAAGIGVLLARAGIGVGDVDRVFLAGGFGNYLDPRSALSVGLLPPGIDPAIVHSIGNAALAGARLCLLSESERAEAERISREAEYVELSGLDRFAEMFAEEMLFKPV